MAKDGFLPVATAGNCVFLRRKPLIQFVSYWIPKEHTAALRGLGVAKNIVKSAATTSQTERKTLFVRKSKAHVCMPKLFSQFCAPHARGFPFHIFLCVDLEAASVRFSHRLLWKWSNHLFQFGLRMAKKFLWKRRNEVKTTPNLYEEQDNHHIEKSNYEI